MGVHRQYQNKNENNYNKEYNNDDNNSSNNNDSYNDMDNSDNTQIIIKIIIYGLKTVISLIAQRTKVTQRRFKVFICLFISIRIYLTVTSLLTNTYNQNKCEMSVYSSAELLSSSTKVSSTRRLSRNCRCSTAARSASSLS